MVIDKRVHDVLDIIVNEPNITGVELAVRFNLTRKQLSYTILKINRFLESHQLETITRLKTGKLCVPITVIDRFRNKQASITNHRYIYSEEERTHIIIFILLTRVEKLSLLHLSSTLTVSQNTIINDIKKIQPVIAPYHMNIHYDRENGYRIAGHEIEKRYLLLKLIRKILRMPIAQKVILQFGHIEPGRLEHVGLIFSDIEKKLKILFTDEQLQELIFFISLILHRIETGKIIRYLPYSYLEVEESHDFLLVQRLIEQFGIYHKNERFF